jgi:hypothetical protein
MAAVVGVLLVWLHVRVLPAALPSRRARAAAAVGTAWVAVLLVANTGLALHDARQETSTFSGPGGTLHARAAEGPVLSQAMAAIESETRPGEPILVAPRLTALYVMSDRENPLPQLSLLPGMLPTPADERRAIEQMRDVRLVLLDRTPLETYARGTFGEGYNNVVGAWVRREFSHVRTIPGSGEQLTGIEIWKREGTR